MTDKTLGQVAFEAYVHVVDETPDEDDPHPVSIWKWDDLMDTVKRGWEAAATAVALQGLERSQRQVRERPEDK